MVKVLSLTTSIALLLVSLQATAAENDARSGEEIYQTYCHICHTTGLLGAPKKGDKSTWEARANALVEEAGEGEPLDLLLEKSISGINAMPPKGTCADCSDEELKATITYMSDIK